MAFFSGAVVFLGGAERWRILTKSASTSSVERRSAGLVVRASEHGVQSCWERRSRRSGRSTFLRSLDSSRPVPRMRLILSRLVMMLVDSWFRSSSIVEIVKK
uniref:(northern house mosquito) hypothetical protein n=1 Tax=Culex pipiens TaxID=7175 RepID=A0A8D8KDA5_CULPI